MVRQAIRQAHGREQSRTTHHPEHGRRTTYLPPKKLDQVSFMYNPEAPFGLEPFSLEPFGPELMAERKHRGHVLSSYSLFSYDRHYVLKEA